MATPYTKLALIERIKKHLVGDFTDTDFKLVDDELLLLIDSNIPTVLRGLMYDNVKISGIFEVPDSFLITYQFTITTQNEVTSEWYITLPQPPLALPTGYDITDVYIGSVATGRSESAVPIKSKRQGYRRHLPQRPGFNYRVEGSTMYLWASSGAMLFNETAYVQMPISRTDDVNAPLYMPDEAIKSLFDMTVQTILQRMQIPQDIILDGLPAGNKTS